MHTTQGLHHVTGIAGDPQRNVDFYEGFLGQRFVKKTVNFDDPNAYHLYYGDYVGSPGTAMTFFSWQQMRPAIPGSGVADAVYYRIPEPSLAYWEARANEYEVPGEVTELHGVPALKVRDPDNLVLYLVTCSAEELPDLQLWEDGFVPVAHQLRGFYGCRIIVQRHEMLAEALTAGLGYTAQAVADDVIRYTSSSDVTSVLDVQQAPDELPAQPGVGAIHHVAVRARDDEHREALRQQLIDIGLQPTGLIDRTFFHSTYCITPAGVLLEIATDAPGFTVNESSDDLGERLVLPESYELYRAQIESQLPAIMLPRHRDW